MSVLVEEEVAAAAEKDQNILLRLIETAKQNITGPAKDIGNKLGRIQTSFVWPDKAAMLLIELFREREEEFNGNTKRHTDL